MSDDTTQAPVGPTAPVVDETVAPAEPTTPVDAPVAPEAPVDAETPAEDASEPVEEPSVPEVPEVESPAEDVSEPAEEPGTPAVPATPTTPEVPPVGDKDGDAVADELARVEKETEELKASEAKLATDLSPVEEAQASTDPNIDSSNIGLTTNDDFTANLPKNENGQVEYDENGNIVGV